MPQWHKITGYTIVCCEVLQVEEDLPATSVMFYMRIKKAVIKTVNYLEK